MRIDTLAFDPESRAFIVIEYKKDRNFSVVDQGFAYLALMLNNKADFILEYNEKMRDNLKRGGVDWSQSRVIFISPQFTTYQKGAIEFKDLPIELWEVKKFENNTILYNQLKPASTSESIKTISKDKTISVVSREVKEYSIEDHFKPQWRESLQLFDELRYKILEIDENIKEKILKHYIAYEINNHNFTEIQPQANGLKLFLDEYMKF